MIPAELTVAKLVAAKVELERTVFEAAKEALDEFEARTGITPTGLSFDFATVTTIGSRVEKRMLLRAIAEIEL